MEKIIAMYLPQFYETPENNKWWGKGFTEWVSAKNAKCLYENHYQPHIPLNENYYNLLKKETMLSQVKMMKNYNVFGMCFYHYWFKDGRQTLEKPAENLLKWKDVDMPFCFSWANESWARTWSNIDEKNVWFYAGEDQKEMESNPSGILLEQQYGEEREWKQHFEYLKQFFKDERYIKIQNKPIFLIYQPNLIDCFNSMKEVWNQLAKDEGFDGVYFIACNTLSASGYDKILLQEPSYTIHENPYQPYATDRNVRGYYDYEEVWKRIVSRRINSDVIYGGFVGYDDTPRRNKSGIVIGDANPEIFKEYLTKLLKLNDKYNNEYCFINAWNEWGEGMHLEPDQKYGYQYLDAVKEAVETYKDVILDDASCNDEIKKDYMMLRYESYWRTLHHWMLMKEKGIALSTYLITKGYKNVAIYGLGMLGKHLVVELQKSEICIAYGIDENAENLTMQFPIVPARKARYDSVDLIIVTVVYDYETIEARLKKKTNAKIISLLDLLKVAQNI